MEPKIDELLYACMNYCRVRVLDGIVWFTISLYFDETAVIHKIFKRLNLSEEANIITHNNKEIHFTIHLVNLDICETKPICISRFTVYYTIGHLHVKVAYYFFHNY